MQNPVSITPNCSERLQAYACLLYTSLVEKDTLLEKKATDTKGTLTFDSDLPHGKYYVKEEVRKPGYLPNEEVWNVDATYENQNLTMIELNKEDVYKRQVL